MTGEKVCPFVGRGGLKLAHALDTFNLSVEALTCADFGCNVGGFTDCLLSRGASHVYAVDTGYGTLAYRLRIDPRITVMERTNALHAAPPDTPVDLVVIDMGWTTQDRCIEAAKRWLKPAGDVVTLIKPHYEARRFDLESRLTDGVLEPEDAQHVVDLVVQDFETHTVELKSLTKSPFEGGIGKRNKRGNAEWLAWIRI